MAEIIDLKEKGSDSITLRDAIELLDEEFDVNEKDSCLQVSHIIRSLGQNKQWLADFFKERLISQLKVVASNNGVAQSTSQVFEIARSEKGYFLRVNIWMPTDPDHSQNIRKKVFVEEVYHDHTFDLLTLGLQGPGYETELFQYDNNKISGVVGEEVEVERQGRVQFSEGRMIFMRANVDIHAQFAPSDISVSLNLIPLSRKSTITREQYTFDLLSNNRAKISGAYKASLVDTHLSLIDVAEVMGNENTEEVFYDIAKHHDFDVARVSALKVLHKKYSYGGDELLALSANNVQVTKSIEQYILSKT